VALNDTEFLVLERNNRGIGVGAELNTPNKRVYKIDIDGATDVSGIDLDSGATYDKVIKSPTVFIDLAADTLLALGNKSPEKWEGLAIGPQLSDGSYVMIAGTDNDYSVTQNGSNVQFDVYFNFADADPYASSIQCPLGAVTACFNTSNGQPAILTGDHKLLPGVLHAYKASADDLAGYVLPLGRCLESEARNSPKPEPACGRRSPR
jgi:Esterase-like activity of phytase